MCMTSMPPDKVAYDGGMVRGSYLRTWEVSGVGIGALELCAPLPSEREHHIWCANKGCVALESVISGFSSPQTAHRKSCHGFLRDLGSEASTVTISWQEQGRCQLAADARRNLTHHLYCWHILKLNLNTSLYFNHQPLTPHHSPTIHQPTSHISPFQPLISIIHITVLPPFRYVGLAADII